MKLKDKVALVVNGTSGVGKAAARLFAEEGAKVVVADPRGVQGGPAGNDLIRCPVDVTDPDSVKQAVRTAVDAFGKIDILVHTAAEDGPKALLTDLADEEWYRVVEDSLTGQFLFSKYVIPEMLRAGKGSIVFVSGVSALRAAPLSAALSTARAGSLGLTHCLATEYSGKGIRVNAICMDDVSGAREDVPNLMGRPGSDEEAARGVLFLASDESGFITASTLTVDGGLHII